MVLKTDTSKFEEIEEEGEGLETSISEAQPTSPLPQAAVPVPAKAKGGAVAKAAKVDIASYDLLASLEDRLPPVDFGEGVRLVGSNGQLMDGDKKILGDHITLLLLSWNKRWVVSPGVQGQEGKDAARYSLDGQFTTKGEPIVEYVQQLKEDGFDKAAVKEYIDLFGVLTSAAKQSDHVGKSVTVSLSPDSVKAFSGFRRDLVVLGMTGRLDASLDSSQGLSLKITTDIKSALGNSWTRLVPALS